MKLIVMTRQDFFIEEDKILTALFDEGFEYLNLYKPNAEPVLSERLLSLLPENYRKKIIVHDHYYLKNEFDLGGIHLNDENDEITSAFKNKVSCTCNDIFNLGYKDMRKKFQHIILNNTFDGKYSDEELSNASRNGYINKKVYAMGGINAETIKKANDLGFGGVVLRGDLWDKFDIHRQDNYQDLINYFTKIKKLIG